MNGEANQVPQWGGKKDQRKDIHNDEEIETSLLGNHDIKESALIDMTPMGASEKCSDEKNDNTDDDEDWEDDGLEDDDDEQPNIISRIVLANQNFFSKGYAWLSNITRGHLLQGVLLLAYFAYVIVAITHKSEGEDFWRLIGCTIFGIFIAVRFRLARLIKSTCVRLYGSDTLSVRAIKRLDKARFFMRWMMYAFYMAIIFYILYTEGVKDPSKLRSLTGLFASILICLLMSGNPKKINWHTIYVSVGLQFLCTLLFLKWSFGRQVLFWIQDRLDEFFDNSKIASEFMFGPTYEDHFMVFGALPIILVMGATMSVLYQLGAMQLVVNAVGSFLSYVLDTDPVESTAVAAGIFLEGVISILSLKPFLPNLTKSQLFVVLTSVFSSLGGAYLGVLVKMEIPLEHLFTAMMISAPATFTVCKLIYPETKTKKKQETFKFDVEKSNSLFDAIQDGSTSMLPLLGNVIAIGFVFMTAISWVDHTFAWLGDRVGLEKLTMSSIFSYILYPVPLAMGIDEADCTAVATLWGYRLTSSNFVAFLELVKMRGNRKMLEMYQAQTNMTGPVTYDGDSIRLELWNQTLTGGMISVRSEAITTYSLSGFSSILSVGIAIGVIYTLLPNRKSWISKVPIRALIAGNVANFMSGCLASFFY